MQSSLLVALLGLAASPVRAAPSVILEETRGIPPGWSFQGSANASDTITLFVALKQPGMEQLKARLNERQDPGDPSFGQHWSRDEVRRHRQPDRDTARAVSDWLRGRGIGGIHEQGGLLSFEVSAQMVKSLFEADLGYFAYEGTGDRFLRALSYKIPAWLRGHVDFVHPLTNFMPPRPRRGHGHRRPRPNPKPSWPKPTKAPATTITTTATSEAPASTSREPTFEDLFPNLPCFAATVPHCIKQLYNMTYMAPLRKPSPSRFGVAGFLEQWILFSDVDAFLDDLAPTIPASYNLTVELINGATNPQDSPSNAGIEASLDVQYAMALGYPAPVTYYITGGRGTKLDAATGKPLPEDQSDNEPYLEFLDALLAKPDEELPHVLSISYADDEPTVPRAYAERVCDMFAALAARGVTVFVATGDAGAAGQGHSQCYSHEARAKRYISTFPASCPYVTAVGATHNVGPPVAGAHFSAGGFSDLFPRPPWQDAAVRPYLARLAAERTTHAAPNRAALFDPAGRATPDLSAIGAGFQILMGGEYAQVLGTSASTPVVAAMVALVNDARLRAGKPSVGWLNPLLYEERVRRTLLDVTEGTSAGCWFEDGTTAPGWAAGEGFDCVTGLGAVDDFYELMAALV